MNYHNVVIRIRAEERAVDWNVQRPDQITFRETLVSTIATTLD